MKMTYLKNVDTDLVEAEQYEQVSTQFVVEARKYFEVDVERLERAKDDDLVLVTIDFTKKKAEFIWYGEGENPANFPSEEDDFDAVVELWEKLGKPTDTKYN